MAHLRHLAVRIWISIFFWILITIWMLPLIQKVIGVQWLVVPALALMPCIYLLVGIVMERSATAKLNRLLTEASVMERAGMIKETAQSLDAAVDLFDSFLLSANARKEISEKLLTRVARHRLARGPKDLAYDEAVLAYLEYFPSDKDAAQIWLQAVLNFETLSPRCADIITKLSQEQPQNKALQHLLGRVFLSESRTDFEALQVYHRVVELEGFSDKNFVVKLAGLLLNEGHTDEWALEIYLDAYSISPKASRILNGILACVQNISAHERNRRLLMRARDLLSRNTIIPADALSQDQTLPYTQTIMDPSPNHLQNSNEADETLIRTEHSATILLHKKRWRAEDNLLLKLWQGMISGSRAIKKHVRSYAAKVSHVKIDANEALIVRGAVIVTIIGGGIFLALNLADSLFQSPQKKKTSPSASVAIHGDPFTLQVGAYLSQKDAKKIMQKLRQQNLNAYLTEAHGRDKRWYQVRISHFADRNKAKVYGESLKSKGLINDYYVANYKPPLPSANTIRSSADTQGN